jgi:AcrR family transcriptional regulator
MPPHPPTDTRQRLIDAAAELFWERGYAATGLSDILDAAGARGGSLYHFFPTKDDLLLAVIDHHARVIASALENALAARETPHDKILGIINFYRGFMRRTTCSLGCPMTNLSGEVADSHPQAAARLTAFADRLTGLIAENLALISEHAGVDSHPTARSIACMIQGALLQSRAARTTGPLDDCAATVRTLIGAPEAAPVIVRPVAFAHA